MSLGLILDLVILGIIALCVFLSAKHGFVRTVLELAGLIAAFVIAFSFSSPLANITYDKIIEPSMVSKIEKTSAEGEQAVATKLWDSLPGIVRNQSGTFGISKEKFDELFPLIDKYATAQGESGDCYLVATLIALMNNPLTRPYIYSSFEETKDGILCTIKSYKDYNGTTFFKDGKAEPEERSLYGAKAMQMFEKAYDL